MTVLDKAQGCFIGLAIGDALGAPVEFSAPGTFKPVTGYRSGGVFNLEAGQYTDDSSMALCLADSLLSCGKQDLTDQMERYVRWYLKGENSSTGVCFDIGDGTRRALDRFILRRDPLAGAKDAEGNGSIMRLAPVALRFWFDRNYAKMRGEASAQTTHGSEVAIDCTGYMAKILSIMIQGGGKREVLNASDGHHERLTEMLGGDWVNRKVTGNGHVLDTLEAALWAFHTTDSFQDCVLRAVNLGDDADTVGAVAGQIAGAFYGLSGIPKRWVSGLQDSDRFLDLAHKLIWL
jgi:ADP-ribosyl-[dinitrogen reductase] hydrolase